jgi:hypothetical protein
MTTDMDSEQGQSSQRLLTASHLSAVLATLLTLEIVGLGIYGYRRVQTALQPENLGDRVEKIIRENYPELRVELVSAVKEQSPQIAAEVSHDLISTAPQGREELERFTARQIELGLDQTTSYSAEQFRKLLDEHHAEVEEMFVKLEKAPQNAEHLVLETEADIEQEFGIDVQRQAKMTLRLHRQLNDKLAHLSADESQLSAQELLERRIVRILKTLEKQKLDELNVTLKPGDAARK